MSHVSNRTTLILASLLSLSLASRLPGADRSAAELLPPTTVAYAEISQPQQLLKLLLEHPLRKRIESLDAVRAAMEKKEYLVGKAGVAVVEAQLGMTLPRLLEKALGGGVVLALDAPTSGVVLLARAADDTTQSKIVATLATLAKQDALNKGKSDPVKSAEYRGIKAYAIDQAKYASFERWLIVTNKDELGKQIIDRWLDSPSTSLANDESYRRARESAKEGGTAWGFVNTAILRNAGVAKELFGGQANNVVTELLFGGILSALKHTPFVTARLDFDASRLNLVVSSPWERAWAGEAREHFFGKEGLGSAPKLTLADDPLLVISAYRDISTMWQRAGDLFNEKGNEEIAKADSGLTTLFGGKDFGEDILGSLQPEIQVVVTRQIFAKGQPAPAIKLPAFALTAALKDPAKMQPELRRIFQSLIGFLNIVGAMNGQSQLDPEMEKFEKGQIIVAKFLPDPNAKDPSELKINYNFSPTIAFAGERFIVSSNEQLARQLVVASSSNPTPIDSGRVTNTKVAFRFNILRDVLADNASQLIAQNMLKDGHTKQEAEMEVSALLELLGWLDRAALQLDSSSRELQLSVGVTLKGQ